MTTRLCHTEIVPVGHKKAGRNTPDNRISSSCCIPLSGANRLSRKKEKKIWLSKTGHIWRRFYSRKINVFTGVGFVNQNHNKDTMKGKKITSCVVINSMLQQLREELLEKGLDLRMSCISGCGCRSRCCQKNRVLIAGPI